MPEPVISPTQSVLGYRQWEYFEFQPYASNTPTAWTANNALPTGLTLTAGTGRISGAAEVPGVWVIGITASNNDGSSAEQQFTIGIEPGALVPDSLPWIAINLVTGELQVDGEEVPSLTDEDRRKKKSDATFVPPYALSVKEGDDLLSRISFVRGDTVQDIDLTEIKMVLKEFEPESELVVSGENIEKQGVGTSTNYLLHTAFDGQALAASLANYEEDTGTFFYALAEIEYIQSNSESVGPAFLIRSSATFCIRIERDIANNS